MADKPRKGKPARSQPESAPQITLHDPDASGRWTLERIDENGQPSRLLLSDEDVVTLAQSAARLMDRLLQSRQAPGGRFQPARQTPVENVSLGTDAHKTVLLLTMHHAGTTSTTMYSLPLALARGLAMHLPAHVDQIVAAGAAMKKN